MKSISIDWKPLFERREEAVRLAREAKATHFRFTESNTMLILGTKDELKLFGKGVIYSAMPYDPMDPETWDARWIPNSSAYDDVKHIKMWSDEYEAFKRGLRYMKGGRYDR